MIHYCSWCGNEFAPVEYREVPAGELEFCSDSCEDASLEADEASMIYREAFAGGASVF